MAERQGRRTQHKGIKDLGHGMYLVRARGMRDGVDVERERRVRAGNLAEALAAKMALEREIESREPPSAEEVVTSPAPLKTLGAVAAEWLERKVASKRKDGTGRLAPTTALRYAHAIKVMITPYIGNANIARLTRRDLENWRDHLGEHYATSTVNNVLVILRMILRSLDHPLASKVAALDVDDTRITDDEPNALDEDELRRFVAAIRANAPQHYALVLVLVTSGQRISTVLALRWEDIEVTRQTMTFRRRVSAGEILPGVKRSRTGKDVAPLLDEVWMALRGHRAEFSEVQRASGLVFPSANGKHRARSILNKPFAAALKAAGIKKRFTPHGCRRTASSLLRQAAGSAVAKAIVGHTTDAMHEHYAVVPAKERQAASRGAFRVLDGGGANGGDGGAAKNGGANGGDRVARDEAGASTRP